METPTRRRRFFRANVPITKSWILRKIINKIIYDSAEFVFDPTLLRPFIPIHRKKPVARYTRHSQEYEFYYSHTNSPNNLWFFMYTLYLFNNINIYPVAKFNSLRAHLYKLKNNLGDKFESHPNYNHLVDRVYKMQKYYWTLRRFVMHCQYKRAKVQITHDLYMNPIDTDDKKTLALLQNGKLYYFTLMDLSKIIMSAITHTFCFVITPTAVKNPHNNVELKKSDLYTIYFKMRDAGFPIPVFFTNFFRMNFDIHQFKTKYNNDILQYTMNKYVDNAPVNELIGYAYEMIEMVDKNNIWDFDDDFPDEILVRELKPYIKLYLMYYYSISDSVSLERRLRQIIYGNPDFGKKVMESRFAPNPGFHEKLFQPFLVNQTDDFLTSHKDTQGVRRIPVQTLYVFRPRTPTYPPTTVGEVADPPRFPRWNSDDELETSSETEGDEDSVFHSVSSETFTDSEPEDSNENSDEDTIQWGPVYITDENDTDDEDAAYSSGDDA